MKILHRLALLMLIAAGIPLAVIWLTADWLCVRLASAASYHYQRLFPDEDGKRL